MQKPKFKFQVHSINSDADRTIEVLLMAWLGIELIERLQAGKSFGFFYVLSADEFDSVEEFKNDFYSSLTLNP
jgi:hypothetical protein